MNPGVGVYTTKVLLATYVVPSVELVDAITVILSSAVKEKKIHKNFI